jgi:two-component system sensor histidine kinase DctS
MGSIVDVTLRRRMQERERQQGERLAHQARLTMLGEVASALAHELNQPLTAITSYNAGVRRSLARDDIDRAALLAALDRQAEQADRAGRIVKRIREFLTRRSPQRERCDLVEIANHAASLMRRDLARIGATLDWTPPAGLPPVFADPVLIEQVVINLVRNAVDELAAAAAAAVSTGAPDPAALARQPALRLVVARAGEQFLRLGVDDNGPGLAGRTVEQLCSPFYSTKPDGMGMGLAICRSVIESHHGALDAGASPLGGASFSFTLPLYRSEVAVDAPGALSDGAEGLPTDPPPAIASPVPAETPP